MSKKLIMDVGVHHGEDTAFYLQKGFRVVGIEANPALCEELRVRFQEWIKRGDLTLVNIAIAAQDGPVTFFRNLLKSDWSTASPDWADRNKRLGANSGQIFVEGRQFGRVLEEFGIPYYLKVDIEGADMLCVMALRRFSQAPKYLSIESSKTSWRALHDEFSMLTQLGYRRFKVVSQKEVPLQVCSSPAREGNYVHHAFPLGASGAFGEEAPGDWMSARDAIKIYRRMFGRYRMFAARGLLTRFNLNAQWFGFFGNTCGQTSD